MDSSNCVKTRKGSCLRAILLALIRRGFLLSAWHIADQVRLSPQDPTCTHFARGVPACQASCPGILGAILSLIMLFFLFLPVAWAAPDLVETKINERVSVNVLTNDALGVGATITELGKTINGKAKLNEDKTHIEYEPDPNFVGKELITYKAQSEDGATKLDGTLKVTVIGLEGVTAEQLQDAAIILFQAFILALALEAGFYLLFNYRWFIYYAEGRGFKVPLMLFVALVLVQGFGFDLVQKLTAIFVDPDPTGNWVSILLSSMIIAGGTSTVFLIYRALGLRPPTSEKASSAFRRADFGRIKFFVTRGPVGSVSSDRDLEIFIDDRLYGTIPAGKDSFPDWRITSLPVPTSATKFKIAIASDYSGQKYWERELKISKLKSLTLHFDLSSDPPQKVADPLPDDDNSI